MPHQHVGIIAEQVPQVPGELLLKVLQLLQGDRARAVGLVSPTSAPSPLPPSTLSKSQTGLPRGQKLAES